MKIAITGGTGFVGKHVVGELLGRGIHPTIAILPGSSIPESMTHLAAVELDISKSPYDAFELLGQPDILIHLAWSGLPNYKSLHHFETELPAQYRFLAGLVRSGLQNLLVTGTCFEYGMQSGPLNEETETRPNNPYGFAKDMLRRQLEFLRQISPFNFTWARLFYVFGAGQAPNSLLPQLQKAVSEGFPTFNMSGGEQLRDYLPIEAVAAYLVDLALKQNSFGPVNVSSGRPVSVRSLVESWIAANGWNISLNLGHFPYPDYEPMAFWGGNDKLKSLETSHGK